MSRPVVLAALSVALVGSGCAGPSQARYHYSEVGQPTPVQFGTVVGERQVDIQGQNTGLGGILGGGAGAAAGAQFGHASGNIAATLGGAALGLILGALAEQSVSNHTGTEYTVTMASGQTVAIVQNHGDKDIPIRIGDRVMVEGAGAYQRVLPANDLPEQVQRPKGIQVTD